MKTTKHITRTPAIPVVPPAPAMHMSLAIFGERLLLLADGAVGQAAEAVKAGDIQEALKSVDQATNALRLALRAKADVGERTATLATIRDAVEAIGSAS